MARKKTNDSNPQTIEELKTYCVRHGMPLRRMRFFIGEDYQEPKAFGICRDGNEFVVYKNKADGSRSVRYRGPDEAYAVQELYRKLLDECHKRNIYPDGRHSTGDYAHRNGWPAYSRGYGRTARRRDRIIDRKGVKILLFIAFLVFLIALIQTIEHGRDGYYRISEDQLYYRYGSQWYAQAGTSWYSSSGIPDTNCGDYYEGTRFNSAWGGGSFTDSYTWKEINSHSGSQRRNSETDRYGSWDNDSGYNDSSDNDYSDWDPGDTDWNSDW